MREYKGGSRRDGAGFEPNADRSATPRENRRGIRFYFTPTTAVLRRVIFYGIAIYLLLLLQSTLAFFKIFGHAVPGLVIAAVSAIGFFDSERAGAVTGIAAGWALDAYGGSTVVLMPVVCMLVGYFSGYVADRYLPRAYLPWCVCLGATGVVNSAATIIYCIVNDTNVNLLVFILRTLLPEYLFTVIFGLAAGLLARLFVRLSGAGHRYEAGAKDRSV